MPCARGFNCTGTACFDEVVAAFGADIVGADGEASRANLSHPQSMQLPKMHCLYIGGLSPTSLAWRSYKADDSSTGCGRLKP